MVVNIPDRLEWCEHDGGVVQSLPKTTLTSDASGYWGCGASGLCFSGPDHGQVFT